MSNPDNLSKNENGESNDQIKRANKAKNHHNDKASLEPTRQFLLRHYSDLLCNASFPANGNYVRQHDGGRTCLKH
jgi:hypothetical protein